MTILHICLFQMKPWITQQPSHTLSRRKVFIYKKITMKQSPLISEFHLLFTPRISSICHKTILPQQMHGAVDIIITHLNIIQACSMHAAPNVYSWIFTHDKRETLFTKNLYAHILYIWKCISMPCPPTSPHLHPHSLRPLSPSPALSHVGGSTGHAAIPHQYANWWNASPAFPCATVSEARSGSSS